MMASTGALMVESISSSCYFPLAEPHPSIGGSYFNFYQLKLRQLITQNQYRKEQEIRVARQKQSHNNQQINAHLFTKRLRRENMNQIREKLKIQAPALTKTSKHDEKVASDTVASSSYRSMKATVTFVDATIIGPSITATAETCPKSILKAKAAPLSMSSEATTTVAARRRCMKSAPPDRLKNVAHGTRSIIKRSSSVMDIGDDNDTSLSKANGQSFTQAVSSSQMHANGNQQRARQSTLNTILLHLNTHTPTDTSKWTIYRDLDDKFTASIASTVYRDFERIVL